MAFYHQVNPNSMMCIAGSVVAVPRQRRRRAVNSARQKFNLQPPAGMGIHIISSLAVVARSSPSSRQRTVLGLPVVLIQGVDGKGNIVYLQKKSVTFRNE